MGLPDLEGKIAVPDKRFFFKEARMDSWIQSVRHVLERAPTGALPLSAIAEELKREGTALNARDPWLLTKLTEDRESFRVIPVPRGPWADGVGEKGDRSWPDDAWIILKCPPERGYGRNEEARGRIQEGFQAWAREMDAASPASVARWIRANLEGARICRALGGCPSNGADRISSATGQGLKS
jgi:hypothetical protein